MQTFIHFFVCIYILFSCGAAFTAPASKVWSQPCCDMLHPLWSCGFFAFFSLSSPLSLCFFIFFSISVSYIMFLIHPSLRLWAAVSRLS